METIDKHLRALELPKVLEKLAVRACNDDARDEILALAPAHDLEGVEGQLRLTEDAYLFLAKYGAPSFGGLVNVNGALARASASARRREDSSSSTFISWPR